MTVLIIPPDLTSADKKLSARTVDLNGDSAYNPALKILDGTGKSIPVGRFVNRDDIEQPPAPAWYLPDQNDLYIHVDEAGIHRVPVIEWAKIADSKDRDLARIVGLYSHECGHAAISEHMTPLQMAHKHYFGLLNLLEELRVENYALRKHPLIRRFLRASFAIVLANLPEVFETKAHVVGAWTIARGRTLAGVASPDETNAVDVAARTILGDDTVDALTDLLQEALTLRLDGTRQQRRMIEICDEWTDLIGDMDDTGSCTHGVREAGEGEEPNTSPAPAPAPGDDESDDEDSGSGGGSRSDDEADAPAAATEGHWGDAGADEPEHDSDAKDLLDDEAAELMGMLARDLADLMQDEWMREPATSKTSDPGVWAARVFGTRKHDLRLTKAEPTGEMRQHVVQVAQALSNLSLPAITKTAKHCVVPPGRLRSREAVRASAERAQGRMVTAKPWRGTQRRHSQARPVIIGIATDTSGSMRWAEDGVAEFAYVYTNAGHRIGARTAAVTFGDAVHRIARPGEVMSHVQRKSASDGTEQFDYAMAALDGVLHLSTPSPAARILFVVSDGALVKSGEPARATEWLRKFDKAGTHVIWITDRDMDSTHYTNWLRKTHRKIPTLTVLPVESARHGRVFDMLNRQALAAIGQYA